MSPMIRSLTLLPALLPLLAAGCTAAPAPVVSAAAAGQVLAAAAQQVRRCYRDPAAPSAARRIVTRLRVRYGPDGALIGLPLTVSQQGVTEANRAYAERMAEAASLAVIRCSPLRQPPRWS